MQTVIWSHTDTAGDVEVTCEEGVEATCWTFDGLCQHHSAFMAQTACRGTTRKNLPVGSDIVLLDFVDNYSLIV